MKIWHAITSGKSGVAISGPIGALMCAVSGDEMQSVLANGGGSFDLEDREAAFAVCAIAIGAKVSAADGWVQLSEVQAFEKLLNLDAEVRSGVIRVFDEARRSPEEATVFAEQFAELFQSSCVPKEILIGTLLHVVHMDNNIHNAELDIIRKVSTVLGLEEGDFNRLKAIHLPWRADNNHQSVLGLSRYAKKHQIEQAYNKFMANIDMDDLNAQGIPIEFSGIVEERANRIESAYQALMSTFHN